MRKKIKIVAALLLCTVVLLSCQTGTAANIKHNDEHGEIYAESEDDPDIQGAIIFDNIREEHLYVIRQASAKPKIYPDEKTTDFESYIIELTELDKSAAEMVVSQSQLIGIDPYIILAIMRVESNFNPMTVGSLGERGLGQLMDNTAKPVAANLDLAYEPDKLFDPVYNILLFTTQLGYLYDFYDGDLHKTLTAYNRGQYGLEKYIASRSAHINPAVSEYSSTILEFATKYKQAFDN